MRVFDLDRRLVDDYEHFSRSFTRIRAEDIRVQVDQIYANGKFWPEPLISINPHFEKGASIADLVADGTLHQDTGHVFRVGGRPITLHRHQEQAVSKAAAKKSFVVTTGTGSGKSLCFFIPIIDAAIRARAAGEAQRTRAIIVYPMNALANSQIKEIEKFIQQSGLPDHMRPTVARYTGQEPREERELVRKEKPDILLTNFMMLELLMTRQDELDRAVIANAAGLDFIVLDELHTYRGRQGADVAMLVRRVRDRLCPGTNPICIGTSATMASEGSESRRAEAVAEVATRLFGANVSSDAVIDETLQRATDDRIKIEALRAPLTKAIEAVLPSELDNNALFSHPLAAWIELMIGLDDGQTLARRPPITIGKAAEDLATFTGLTEGLCRDRLETMLTLVSLPEDQRGGTGDRAFLAFKLHRFLSGAGRVYATLRKDGRRVTLDGQTHDPHDREARLYPTFFCRGCGQEFHPVTLADDGGVLRALPRSIDETIVEDADGADEVGYLMPEPIHDVELPFEGKVEDYPEDWTELDDHSLRLRRERRKQAPRSVTVDASGAIGGAGRKGWFIPGKFRFCPACRQQPEARAREINKLAGLSAEGRSSATTLLVSSALRWMNEAQNGIPHHKRKLLGFTDNRQDAALQAGHFNDFLFVSLLRAGVLAAVRQAGSAGLSEDEFGRRVQTCLGFVADNAGRREEWMDAPETKGQHRQDAERALSRVLTYRVWIDQRRGWRFTNPNLEELGLVTAHYPALDELAKDDSAFADAPVELRNLPASRREHVLRILFEALRQGLAVTADALEQQTVESTVRAAGQYLREPWSISDRENLRAAAALVIDAPRKQDTSLRSEGLIIRGGPASRLARAINKPNLWGRRLPAAAYREVLAALLDAAKSYGLVRPVTTSFDVEGWRLAASAIRLVVGSGSGKQANPYFRSLYSRLADALANNNGEALFGLEGREHTAQVDAERREWREWRFRFGDDDRARIDEKREEMRKERELDRFLPTLFCSPTMELGVDISALNTVYLRNVPPSPANYAQRSGRAGRSGQAALVITYCAAQSPHDQYYFSRREQMVKGIVRPPALDLANRDLVVSHLHAVWLAEAGQELSPDIPNVLDLAVKDLPVKSDIVANLGRPELASRAGIAMQRILHSIDAELTRSAAAWAADRKQFLDTVVAEAPAHFSDAFDRWRQLYDGARTQLIEANRKSEMHGLDAQQRRDARIAQAQANEQLALLEKGRASGGSDFYTYRYLATEGFLPGYNFPRLPLYAYVPAVGAGAAKPAYLQRARFLAIAEFGPRSLIYHEGRAYRVYKAKLPAYARNSEDGKLATSTLFICEKCGAAHDKEHDRCHACDALMAGIKPIKNILRIDNVETTPAERITANDEDRQRQGFEIQTVFSWPARGHGLDVVTGVAADTVGPLLTLRYSQGAEISRINKGLRRRKKKSLLGFGIDAATGRWTTAPGDDDEGDDDTPDGPVTQRVVPIVQDNKNAALLQLAEEELGETTITTLQHALTRGIEIVFQLEEGEVLTEPVPSRDNRRAILAFEATEGGAGVLGRLVAEADALRKVAKTALELMHFTKIDEALKARDPDLLEDVDNANCVKGCYRCLLSYYNQPDQELIDRTDKATKDLLMRLACSEVKPAAAAAIAEGDGWAGIFAKAGIPATDAEALKIGSNEFPLVWRSALVVATSAKLDTADRAAVEALGYAVATLTDTPDDAALDELRAYLGVV